MKLLNTQLETGNSSRQPKHLAGRYKGLDPRNTSTPEMSSRPSANLQTVQDMDEDLGSAVLATASRSAVTVVERTTVAVPAQDIPGEETVVSEDLGFIFSQPAAATSTAAVGKWDISPSRT